MQLADIRSEVLTRAGVDSQDAMASTAILDQLINGAIRTVTNMRDWDWNVSSETITVIAATSEYARAADARKTIRLENTVDGFILQLVTPMYASRFLNRTSSMPSMFYVEAGELVLIPTPNKAGSLKHTYAAKETALATVTDEPTIPDYAIDLVIVKAAIMLSARTDNTSQHTLLRREEIALEDSLADDARRAKGAPILDHRRDW